VSRTGRRASEQGLLTITLDDYLKLLRWSARAIQSGQRRTIPRNLATILERLELEQAAWETTLTSYDESFCHAVGPEQSLSQVAERMGVHHLKGVEAARRIFR